MTRSASWETYEVRILLVQGYRLVAPKHALAGALAQPR
jgi:hypothetical protein